MSANVSTPPVQTRLFFWLTVCLLGGFMAVAALSYFTLRDVVRRNIGVTELPLTADTIYSEIQRDIVPPVLISSLMSNNSFLRQWAMNEVRNEVDVIRYLADIKRQYQTVTAFFADEKTRAYFHADGRLHQLHEDVPTDKWFFRVRQMATPYEINIDSDPANHLTPTIFINFKVLDDAGNFIGATGVGLTVEHVSKLMEFYQGKYQREIFLVDHNGMIELSASSTFLRGRTLESFPEFQNLQFDLANSQQLSYKRHGVLHMLSTRFLPDLNWTIVVVKAEDGELLPVQHSLIASIIVCLVITGIVLLLVKMLVTYYQSSLAKLAVTDTLTDCHNRLGFNLIYHQLEVEEKRQPQPVSVMLIDVDHFKLVNDTYGHLAGDQVLVHVANTIKSKLRESDIVCRWGGEEFLILAKNCLRDDAFLLAENVRLIIAEEKIQLSSGQRVQVTVSIGVSERLHHEDRQAFFNRVDQAMYEAKKRGRNCVVMT